MGVLVVDFYISSVDVFNFRGIKELSLELESDQPTILIGPNNSGKSTLLDAMALCLNAAKFYNYSIEKEDFWKDSKGKQSNNFRIDVNFEARENSRLPAVKGGIGDPTDVYGVRLSSKIEALSKNRHLFDKDDETILLNKGTPISKGKKGDYKGMGLGGRSYARIQDISKWLPEIWYLDPENLFASLYVWRTGPLQRLLGIYKDKLLTEEWKTKSGKEMPGALFEIHDFINNIALKTPFWKDELAPKFKGKFKNYLGKSTAPDITPGLNVIEDWIMSEFLIHVAPASNMAPVESKRLGDGWQSLLRLAALELALEFTGKGNKVLLLVEEPETYLHPHLRRKLRKIFSEFQEAGNQVLITTHSQELISFAENQNIIRLNMTSDGVDGYEYSTETADQALKDQEKLLEKGNQEIVFANKAILTEGKGTQFAVHLGLEKLEIDADAEAISIIDCGGVSNLPAYAELCSNLGIPWFAIHDKDIQDDGKQKPGTIKVKEKLKKIETDDDIIAEWDNDLEDVIGYRKANSTGKVNPKWIMDNLEPHDWEDLEADTDLEDYCSVLEDIKNWIEE